MKRVKPCGHNEYEFCGLDCWITKGELKMKFIIVIRGIDLEYYEDIRRDISQQCGVAGYHIPIFAYLPGGEPAIEIVWTDAEMELEHLKMISEQAMITVNG